MKRLLLLLILFVISSCSTNKHYFKTYDGKWLSERKFKREIHRAVKHAMKSLSEEQIESISDTNLKFSVIIDTTNN